MKIIEYNNDYSENVKDLLVELWEYIASMDKEKYCILTSEYREKSFEETMKEVQNNNGKIFLANDNNKIVGLIIGIINEVENLYNLKLPKGGKITKLIVTKNCRTKGIGQALLNKMEEYFKSVGCEGILIEVFEYNDLAKNFYYKNKYFNRLTYITKHIDSN